jgi:hypothetical protein
VKAFNVVFGEVLAQVDRPADVLIAGDDAPAKADVSAFIESLGLRPVDTGDLTMAGWLESAALLIIGLAKHRGSPDFTGPEAGHWPGPGPRRPGIGTRHPQLKTAASGRSHHEVAAA